jgi:hypothetical protein
MYKLRQAVHDLDIRNLYFDNAGSRMCANEFSGCGWNDDAGKRHTSYNVLGNRDFAKRAYVMFQKERPGGLVARHVSGTYVMATEGFCEIVAGGEDAAREIATDEAYYTVYPLDHFRTEGIGTPWGPMVAIIPQFRRASQLMRPERVAFWTTPEAQKPINHFKGLEVVHNGDVWPAFGVSMDDIWEVFDRFGWDDKLAFSGYWEDNPPARIVAPASEQVVVSTYKRPGNFMLAAMNNTDTDATVTIEMDVSRLGAKPDALADGLTGETFAVKDERARVPLAGRAFRLLIGMKKGEKH